MRNLPEFITESRLDRAIAERETRRFGGADHRARVSGIDGQLGKALSEELCLAAPFIGERRVDRARKTIFGGCRRRAVANEVQPRDGSGRPAARAHFLTVRNSSTCFD